MLLSVDVYIPFPRRIVYATYRDKLLELVPYLSNVQRIEVKSRRQDGELTYFVNEWHGGGEIPAIARAVVSEALLSWTDSATWNETQFTTEWQIQTHAFTEAVYCAGKNCFFEDGNGTRIESRGKLNIDADRLNGVPRLFAGTIASAVEDVLGKKVEPNLRQLGEGVRRYLEQSQSQQV